MFHLQPLIRLYDIPDNTFDSDNEENEDEDSGKNNFIILCFKL